VKLTIPELCLVVLIGPTGSGKSTFARKHFKSTEILSSDFCRGLVSDDENSQDATNDAFDVLRYVAGKRLGRGLLTLIDATNVQEESRKPLIELAREHDALAAAIVLKLPEKICHERNRGRPDRDFGPHVVRGRCQQLRRSLRNLSREGFRYVHVLDSVEAIEQAQIERQPLWNNRKHDHGPFDIIGDVHGCSAELLALLQNLGYDTTEPDRIVPPPGRKAIFLGDLVDRGPDSPGVLRLVMSMVEQATALCLPGNHDVKLLRKLRGKNVQVTHGLAETLDQLKTESPEFLRKVEQFIDSLVGHYALDGGRLVVAHAGMKERYIGRASRRVREFALYGETTGETDEFGLPVRHNWAAEYRGPASIVYGHTPVPQADWLNRTINIDTGCVFGGSLTALRWPEREIVFVPAARVYAEPARPFLPEAPSAELRAFGQKVLGKVYAPRPGSYALIPDDRGRIAVIQSEHGWHLPGGGAEPGETPEQTLLREVREECGCDARIAGKLFDATQFVHSDSEGGFEKQCEFFEARLEAGGTEKLVADVTWLDPAAAAERLTEESHAWAVRNWAAGAPPLSLQQQHDDVLDIDDLLGKRIVTTRLHHSVTVREENAAAALEVMSRFAADPRWLIYLPPTMSPTETTDQPGLLEHPTEAFAYFRAQGVSGVICEEKHMGSRAVVLVCRDQQAAMKRFGVRDASTGIIYTRTGRRFFDDSAIESQLLDHVRAALTRQNFWDEFASDWFCLDCELMPWSAKAQDLLKQQYAAVGSAGRAALAEVVPVLQQAAQRYGAAGTREGEALAEPPIASDMRLGGSLALPELLERHVLRRQMMHQYIDAYRGYCWPVNGVLDLKLAPFHLLASEGAVHADKDHPWHMQTLGRLADASTPIQSTSHRVVDLSDEASAKAGIDWWESLTDAGGEGMVVKPLDFVVRGPRGLVQPAVKCRGREYLRIIYGPQYTADEHLARLRSRGLGAKRSLALREFALGIEALERFVRREPLRQVHECVFAVLALESEPVDPRL